MKLLELPNEFQNALITALLRFTYPLYCETGVEGYDYYFIGSCFPLRAGDRLFFVFTEHQHERAHGGQLFVIYPEDTTKAIAIHNEGVVRFPTIDLAAFEVHDEDLKQTLHVLDISLIKKPDESIDFEYAVIGCQTTLNYINYDTKTIQVRKSGLITDTANLNVESPAYDFSGLYMVTQNTESSGVKLDRASITDQTQGLSGSPILAFSVIHPERKTDNLELYLTGIATHVAEKTKILYSTHPIHIVQALDHSFHIFRQANDNE